MWLATALVTILVSLSGGLVVAVQTHAWSHQESVPRIVSALRRVGLIVGADEHAAHHEGTFKVKYCIASGWWNRPLDRWRVFERAERVIGRLGTR